LVHCFRDVSKIRVMIDMSEMLPFMPLMRLQAKAWRSAEETLPQRHLLLAQRGVEALEHAGADGADGAIGSTSAKEIEEIRSGDGKRLDMI
jgi:hypothetical protein